MRFKCRLFSAHSQPDDFCCVTRWEFSQTSKCAICFEKRKYAFVENFFFALNQLRLVLATGHVLKQKLFLKAKNEFPQLQVSPLCY